ncbi:MAG: hypothetical protein WDN24_21545 [Sphingomonas sp.]
MTLLLIILAVPIALVAGLALFSAYIAGRIGAALPAQGQRVDVAGGRIHYVALGPENAKGPPLVMIHGIVGQLRHFSYALAGRMAKDHRVWLVDRPGWGHSTLSGPRRASAGRPT